MTNTLIELTDQHIKTEDQQYTKQLKEAIQSIKDFDISKDITKEQLIILHAKEHNFQESAKIITKHLETQKKEFYSPYKQVQTLEKLFKDAIGEVSVKDYLKEQANKLNVTLPGVIKKVKYIPNQEITLKLLGIDAKLASELERYIKIDTSKIAKAIYFGTLNIEGIKVEEIKEY